MEFNNYTCPICGKQFVRGDDIVVCPECGAPHHRECYENNGHCFYEDKHGDDFTFEETTSEEQNPNDESDSDNDTVICPNCKTENQKTTFYCVKCGFPLIQNMNKNGTNPNGQGQQPYNGMPPTGTPYGAPYMGGTFVIQADPMAGFQSDEPVSENVTAGELAKFVGKNTTYFMQIFKSILRYDKSRFNFSAFFFSGAYFLYRKMYALGAFISTIVLACTVFSFFIQLTPEYSALYQVLMDNVSNLNPVTFKDYFQGMTNSEILYFFIPTALSFLDFLMMVISGLIANRRYFKHCIAKINRIKSKNVQTGSDDKEFTTDMPESDVNEKIENCGGVNLPILIAAVVVYTVVSYIPYFL